MNLKGKEWLGHVVNIHEFEDEFDRWDYGDLKWVLHKALHLLEVRKMFFERAKHGNDEVAISSRRTSGGRCEKVSINWVTIWYSVDL
jgi:hypothetical protein